MALLFFFLLSKSPDGHAINLQNARMLETRNSTPAHMNVTTYRRFSQNQNVLDAHVSMVLRYARELRY